MCVQLFGKMEMLVIVSSFVVVTEGDSDGHLRREPGHGLGTDRDGGEHRPAHQHHGTADSVLPRRSQGQGHASDRKGALACVVFYTAELLGVMVAHFLLILSIPLLANYC